MPPGQISIAITESSQIGAARRSAARMAELTSLGETDRGKIAIVASELATNLSRHGKEGQLLLRVIGKGAGSGVEILAIDRGPGMADVSVCMRDGYSTGGTAGTGLGAVRRLSTVFDYYSAPPGGTVILSIIESSGLPPEKTPSPPVRWSVISIPVSGETECGDCWSVVHSEGIVSIMVADGLGHGPLAAEASNAASEIFERQAWTAPAEFLEAAHDVLHTTRGAAVSAAQLRLRERTITFAGVGNVCGGVHEADDSHSFFSHNGTIGLQRVRIKQLDYAWPQNSVFIMHSDGLSARWDLGNYPGLFTRHPGVIAGILYRDFARGRDDATVLVLR